MKTDTIKNKWVHYSILGSIYVLAAFTLLAHTVLHTFFHHEMVYANQSCPKIGSNHVIHLINNKFSPDKLTVSQCDRITFENDDQKALYEPALGEHPNHIEYAGLEEKVLSYKSQNSFIAHTKGTFNFHDHIKDQAEGTLIIR